MNKWQNINTAPKDDSEFRYIIGGWFDHGFNVDQCYFDKTAQKWLCNNRADGGYPDFWMLWTEPSDEVTK